MKKGDPYLEQVEKHRQKIHRTKPETGEPAKLPPRSRVHQNKKKKTRLKLKYPVIRLLVLFFVLLPLAVFAVISNLENNKSANSTEEGGIETVNFEVNDPHEQAHEPADEGEIGQEQDTDEKPAGSDTPENGEEGSGGQVSPGKSASQDGKDSSEKAPASGKDSSVRGGISAGGENSRKTGTSEGAVKYHTVKPGETLYRIAMMYYNSQDGIAKIRQANGIIENEIKVGQTLKIPLN
ncbi:LysM peptidoglycan-binding domain-containing protein [Bacillus sp. FJAT-27245]|uniref:LysM peptidoglycan-binding domain-containing protein n=1 Tax=Bacillus sp. FJAT-27245 TaxID=1684144 RepID=UPI0006A7BE68|nr:LysM peptidoglycan-binding domain-containing protein [Bacillus sp. FJAT-27245]